MADKSLHDNHSPKNGRGCQGQAQRTQGRAASRYGDGPADAPSEDHELTHPQRRETRASDSAPPSAVTAPLVGGRCVCGRTVSPLGHTPNPVFLREKEITR